MPKSRRVSFPYMPGVGHGLVHERLGAETGALLRASPRHGQTPHARCAGTPAVTASTPWSFHSALVSGNTLKLATDIRASGQAHRFAASMTSRPNVRIRPADGPARQGQSGSARRGPIGHEQTTAEVRIPATPCEMTM